jgi:hypothetical protein
MEMTVCVDGIVVTLTDFDPTPWARASQRGIARNVDAMTTFSQFECLRRAIREVD